MEVSSVVIEGVETLECEADPRIMKAMINGDLWWHVGNGSKLTFSSWVWLVYCLYNNYIILDGVVDVGQFFREHHSRFMGRISAAEVGTKVGFLDEDSMNAISASKESYSEEVIKVHDLTAVCHSVLNSVGGIAGLIDRKFPR